MFEPEVRINALNQKVADLERQLANATARAELAESLYNVAIAERDLERHYALEAQAALGRLHRRMRDNLAEQRDRCVHGIPFTFSCDACAAAKATSTVSADRHPV